MTLILDILPAAQEDAENAQDWYDEAAPGLGEAFTETYLDALEMLVNMPGIGSRRYAYLFPGINLRT